MARTNASAISVELQLGQALSVWADPVDNFCRLLSATIEVGVKALVDECGIPGGVDVKIRLSTAEETVSIVLNGTPLSWPTEKERTLWEYCIRPNYVRHKRFGTWVRAPAYSNRSGLGSVPISYSLHCWITENAAAEKRAGYQADPEPLLEFLGLLVVEVVAQNAEKLFESPQARLYLKEAKNSAPEFLRSASSAAQSERLVRVLRPVLEQGISLSDASMIFGQLALGAKLELGDEDITEVLISLLRPDFIGIEIQPVFAECLLSRRVENCLSVYDPCLGENITKTFRALAEDIFFELGVRLPDIRLIPSNRINPDSIVIWINHLTRLYRKCMKPDQVLVCGGLEHVQELVGADDVAPFSVLSPKDNTICAVINRRGEWKAKNAGLLTYDPLEYLTLLLKREIAKNAWRLVDCETVEFELARLHEPFYDQLDEPSPRGDEDAFPDLILAALEQQSTPMLTRILRLLLREEISIRNLGAILERLVTYDYITTEVDVTEAERYIVLDDRLALNKHLNPALLDGTEVRLQYVREGFKKYIGHKYTQGQNTLVFYRLDSDFEGRVFNHLAGKQELTPEDIRKIRSALRIERRGEPPNVNPPAILTYSPLRLLVRRLIEDEFPTVPVLSYEEVSPDLNVQRIGRLRP